MKFTQLSLLSLMVFEGASGLKNGQCDENLCTCMIPVVAGDSEPVCPTWMVDQVVGPYDSVRVAHCYPTPAIALEPGETRVVNTTSTGSGVSLCYAAKESFFENNEDVIFPCEFDENGDGFNSLWQVKDGTEVIVNYAGISKPPECLDVMPFTVSPTMAPTTETNPTATSGGAFSNYVGAAVAVVALFTSLL